VASSRRERLEGVAVERDAGSAVAASLADGDDRVCPLGCDPPRTQVRDQIAAHARPHRSFQKCSSPGMLFSRCHNIEPPVTRPIVFPPSVPGQRTADDERVLVADGQNDVRCIGDFDHPGRLRGTARHRLLAEDVQPGLHRLDRARGVEPVLRRHDD